MAAHTLTDPSPYPDTLVDQSARGLTLEVEPRRTLQRLFLVEDRYSVKEIAAKIGWHEEVLRRCIVGPRDLPAKKLPRLTAALQDLSIVKSVVSPLGYSLRPVVYLRTHRPTILILADLSISFGHLYEIAEKLNRGETLTEEEKRTLEDNAEVAHRAIDELVDRGKMEQGK